jgi:hypothetical protein
VHTHIHKCTHVNTHIYKHAHTDMQRHTCARAYTQMHTHVHTDTHTDTHTKTCVHACTHISTNTYTNVHMCTHRHVCTHAHTYTQMYTHAYTHVHTYTETHVCISTQMGTHAHTHAICKARCPDGVAQPPLLMPCALCLLTTAAYPPWHTHTPSVLPIFLDDLYYRGQFNVTSCGPHCPSTTARSVTARCFSGEKPGKFQWRCGSPRLQDQGRCRGCHLRSGCCTLTRHCTDRLLIRNVTPYPLNTQHSLVTPAFSAPGSVRKPVP